MMHDLNIKRLFSLVISFIAMYLYLGMHIGGGYIPSFFVFSTIFIIFVFNPKLNKSVLRVSVYFILFMLVLLLIGVFRQIDIVNVSALLYSSLYLIGSILLFVFTLSFFSRCKPREIETSSLFIVLVITLGVMLEANFDFVKEVSDAFRSEFLIHYYSADLRDLDNHGAIRPKFFTAEPSFVAMNIIFLLSLYFLSAPYKLSSMYYFILIFINLFVVESPVLVLGFLIYPFLYLIKTGSSIFSKNLLFIVVFLVLFLFLFINFLFEGRVDSISIGNDYSHLIRLIFPLQVYYLGNFFEWILGIGYGYDNILNERLRDIFSSYGVDILFSEVELSNKITNSFYQILIFFGIVGLLLFFALIKAIFKIFSIGGLYFYFIALFFGYMNIIGGFNSPRFWFFLGGLIGTIVVINKYRGISE
jgi:hypothetical protein